MRIIGGDLGGRKIHPPGRMPLTRPTTDLAKGGLFNILQHQFGLQGIHTLDLFGGTGSISFELASRGASALTIVEKNSTMADFIVKTAETLGINGLQVARLDVFRYLETCRDQFDFIFAGPPYNLPSIDDLPRIIVSKKLLKAAGWFVLEHTPRNNYSGFPLYRDSRNYGTTVFSIFVNT
jgi:16S rRNA (guanine966-N2)-methyltransferase